MITIGALSERTGVNIETIRYYEKVGLMPVAQRTGSGRRVYDETQTRRLLFIRHARELGFSPAVIRTMIELQESPGTSCERVSKLAQDQRDAVDLRIASLKRLRKELTRMIRSCEGSTVQHCRIIESLAEPVTYLHDTP
ncbi:MAG: helix-turn-helix domain-containing protein [Rhizorhabdus sp.]|uniref:MerR family transcriptional regulator n=1 Tax=Rhizorhabdus sp. TaxID=1968843 RepID=UPI001B4D5036|nr:helix-turn-helix domain-containing protein [Rhizorhabdus sp.]MBP8231232.1 helix-turn-helix domain-containing protein [Rhizorhabdus sp.]